MSWREEEPEPLPRDNGVSSGRTVRYSARVALTKYQKRLGGFNDRSVFLTVTGSEKPETKLSLTGAGEGPLHVGQMAAFSLCPQRAEIERSLPLPLLTKPLIPWRQFFLSEHTF